MSSGINEVTIVGALAKDVELSYTPKGTALAKFSIPVDTEYTTAAGEKRKETYWANITLWDKQAENAEKYLGKGSTVFVRGRLQTREYESKGEKRKVTEIWPTFVKYLSFKDSGASDKPSARHEPAEVNIGADDDVPF